MSKQISPQEALEYLEEMNEIFDYFLGGREDTYLKSFKSKNMRVQELIVNLHSDKIEDRAKFRKKFLDFFNKQKIELEEENRQLKTELKKVDKND